MRRALLGAAGLLLIALVLAIAFLRGGERSAPAALASGVAAREPSEEAREWIGEEEPPAPLPEKHSAPSSAEAEAKGPPTPPGTALDLPADDPVRCVLYGRVTDASGGSLASKDVVVSLEDAAGRIVRAAMDRASYSATGLEPGRWLVNCYASGYRQVRAPIDLGPERVVRHDIGLQPALVLRVKLTAPDGSPLGEALRRAGVWASLVPVATAESPGATFDGVFGSLNNPFGVGQFWQNGYVFERLPPEYCGVLVLDVEPPVFVSMVLQSAVLATQRVDPGATEVAFVLAPETVAAARSALRCRVLDAGTGEAFEGAEVNLISPGGGSRSPLRTDAQGVALLANHDPGGYELWVHAEGRGDVRRQVTLAPGETLDVDAITLVPETWISGRLVDGIGAPVEGHIQIGRVEAGRRVVMLDAGVKSDSRGVFRIGNLLPGLYVIRTPAREGRPYYPELTMATANREVSTLGGPVEDLELVLLPLGRLVLRYERADWESLRVSVLDAQGLERAAERLWQPSQQGVTLPHGPYRLVVSDAEGATVLERAITVGGEVLTVELPDE